MRSLIENNVTRPVQPRGDEIDLIDTVEKPVGEASNKKLLIELSNRINAVLQQENHHELIPQIVENNRKVDALYNQINHHYERAKENSRNLDHHTQYLQQQLSSITKLNQDLQKLDQVNHDLPRVAIGENKSFDLDELIIADSMLVKQLYEVVADIKAVKDSINLISGKFPQKREVINDNNFDTCVKTLRNLSRDLFWLELTKNEMASTMKLNE